MPIKPLPAVPQEFTPASPVVEVFAPSHLRHIADEIASRVREQVETLPTEALHHLLRMGAEIARAREEFERFKQRAGVKPSE